MNKFLDRKKIEFYKKFYLFSLFSLYIKTLQFPKSVMFYLFFHISFRSLSPSHVVFEAIISMIEPYTAQIISVAQNVLKSQFDEIKLQIASCVDIRVQTAAHLKIG